jgi:acyl-coenzyme A synthetase/AMP-(fatty) acid ligase
MAVNFVGVDRDTPDMFPAPLPHCPVAEPMPDVAPPPALTAVEAATSGSTGQSRRYPKHWGGLFQESAAIGTALQLPSTGTHMIATVPPAHMYGFSYGLIGPLTWGMTLDAECPVFPRDLARLLAAAPAPTWLVTTPVHLRAYVESAEPFPRVAGIISSAAPLPIALASSAEARFAAPLIETYGSTETGAIAWRRPTQDTAWQVYPGVTVATDAASGQALVRAPWLPTAGQLLDDLIEVHATGQFAIIGRSSDVIKVGAKRASLGALTETLVTLDGVDDGVIFCPPSTRVDEEPRPAGFVVCAPQALGAISSALRQRVDPVFMPRPLIRVPALPRNPTGKLPRAALDALWRAHALEQEFDAR